MNFGEKLKKLRQDQAMTQPDLAEKMGIEQSYLSKLENNKSLPSNDVFNRFLDVFDIEIADILSGIDEGVCYQLRQLPDVANYYGHQNQQIIINRRRWLIASTLFLSLGAALVFAGNVHLFFSDVLYQYKSHGVVLEGEPKEIFARPQSFVKRSARAENPNTFNQQVDAITARTDEEYLLLTIHRGNIFNEPVEGGSRTYYFQGETAVDPWQSKLIVFIGIFMLTAGFVGLLVEKNLSGPRK